MKKIIFILLIIPIIGFSQVDANNNEKKKKKGYYKWDIGINGGVNINNPLLDESKDLSFDDVGGKLYGLTVVYHFNRFFALKADLDIENRGWFMKNYELQEGSNNPNQNGSSIMDLDSITQVLDYFDIPAFMHIGFGKKFKVDLNIGPYFGFKIKDEISTTTKSLDGNELDDSYIRGEIGLKPEGFDKFDFGLVYGIGFDYQIHKRFSIGFDALYERGMKVINDGNYKNSSIDFDFGINFQLGKKKNKK